MPMVPSELNAIYIHLAKLSPYPDNTQTLGPDAYDGRVNGQLLRLKVGHVAQGRTS